MRNLAVMIKPASSLCNLRCRYCFYADEASRRKQPDVKMMTQTAARSLLANLYGSLDAGDQLTITFQGGEPTLAGPEFFRFFLDTAVDCSHGVNTLWCLQTNGVMLDDSWCEFLKVNRFLVGLSFDLLEQPHNDLRRSVNGKGSYRDIQEKIVLLNKHDVDFNILCTLTEPLAEKPDEVWKQICRNNLRYVQFTPCIGGIDMDESEYWALRPASFASFYTRLFCLWLEEYRKGNYFSVKLFDDLINRIAFGNICSCGQDGMCRPQLVVESDGSTYPCDFYCLDEHIIGNMCTDSVQDLFAASSAFAASAEADRQLCSACPFRKLCGGGCRRMQQATCYKPGESACGMASFLSASYYGLIKCALFQRDRLKAGDV